MEPKIKVCLPFTRFHLVLPILGQSALKGPAESALNLSKYYNIFIYLDVQREVQDGGSC